MNLLRSHAAYAVFGLATMLLASQQAGAQQISVAGIKKIHDADQDGVIQKSEAKNQLLRNFDRVDGNGDGKLDEEELERLVQTLARQSGPRKNAARYAVPDGVTMLEDLSYREGDSQKWKLDLFYPSEEKPSSATRPAVVFIHGGGWRSGDKGSGVWRSLPIEYAQKGYVCVSVNYRLLDEASFPACIEDCKNAVRWLRAHAEKYRVDTDRIGAYGNSAGAHLVAILGLTENEDGLEGDGPYQEFSSSVQSVVCSAPPTNFLNWDGSSAASVMDTKLAKRLFPKLSVEQATKLARNCSPVFHAKAGVPFLVVHGTADKTVPLYQGDSFVEALKAKDADVTYIRVDGAGHGVFNQASAKTKPAMEKFLKRTLGQAE